MEAICHLQAGEPGKTLVWFRLRPKAWEPEAPMSEGRRRWTSQLKQWICPSFTFCSIQALSGLDGAHSNWWGWSALLSLLIPVLISPSTTLTGTPRNHVLSTIWVSLNPVRLTHKISHHSLDHCLWQWPQPGGGEGWLLKRGHLALSTIVGSAPPIPRIWVSLK